MALGKLLHHVSLGNLLQNTCKHSGYINICSKRGYNCNSTAITMSAGGSRNTFRSKPLHYSGVSCPSRSVSQRSHLKLSTSAAGQQPPPSGRKGGVAISQDSPSTARTAGTQKVNNTERNSIGPTAAAGINKSVPAPHAQQSQVATLLGLVSDILTATHASTVEKMCKNFCTLYCELSESDRVHFLLSLSAEYHVNHADVLVKAKEMVDVTNRDRVDNNEAVLLRLEEKLSDTLLPDYTKLFRKIGMIESGVKFLVDFRADILHCLSSHQTNVDTAMLKAMNWSLKDLLSLWFSVGFMHLQRVTWQSSCEILQKISEYEAVHPMRHWTDLKRRVGPYRRCFVFTHHSMPSEPIVVLHTALTREISSSIQAIVSQQRLSRMESVTDYSSQFQRDIIEDADKVTTAIFYSITSTQRGIQGIELGNYLIKRVVQSLQAEFPNMQQFSSLSPIPGFREWLLIEISRCLSGRNTFPLLTDQEKSAIREVLGGEEPLLIALKAALVDNSWVSNEDLILLLREPLLRMCTRYLYLEKHRGYALNSVAHFHLKNGAVLWRVNWLADKTQRGLASSCGLMVNYRYFLDQTDSNSIAYLEHQTINCSEEVNRLVSQLTHSSL